VIFPVLSSLQIAEASAEQRSEIHSLLHKMLKNSILVISQSIIHIWGHSQA